MPGPCDSDQRSALAQAMDCARECLADLGATGYTEPVVVRTRTWSGPMGASTSVRSDVDVELLPRPRVSPAPPKHRGAASGKAADGERRVSGVSTRYTLADLEDAFLPEYTERFFLVGGKPYRLVTEPIEQVDGWTFDLRRMEGRSAASATESPPAAPVNLVPPTWMGTRGVGNTITLHPGTWSGNPSPAYAYSVSLGGSPVVEHVGTTWTDTEDTIDQILIGVVTATNSAGVVAAATQPLGGTGGGACDCDALEAAVTAAEAARDVALADLATRTSERDVALADLATRTSERDVAEAALAVAEAALAVAEAALIVALAERDALQVVVDAIPATVAATVAAATAAERFRALDWFVPGKHATMVFSDPLGLTSAHSLNPTTGAMEVTTNPLVQTATPNLFAGWEGQIFGQVDLVSFFHSAFYHQIRTSLLAPTSTNGNIPHGTDLEVITLIMNGPRATATYWYGGGHAWSTSTASLSRARSSANRDGVQYVGTGGGNGNSASMLTRTQVGNSWNPNTRPISGAGSFVGGSSNLTASTSTGVPPGQSVWGTETWVAVLVGARAGTGAVGHTLRFYADILYSDADMTPASLPA